MAKQTVLWRDVRHRTDAWLHIKQSVDGDKDTATCTHCNTVVDMQEHPTDRRTSAVLKLAREHFYKHKLGPALPKVYIPSAEAVPLF